MWDEAVRRAVLAAGQSLPSFAAAEERRMFGCWCLFAHGRMVAVVRDDAVIVRLPREHRARALALRGAARFTPRPGMTMRELVQLPGDVARSRARLRRWLARAFTDAGGRGPHGAR